MTELIEIPAPDFDLEKTLCSAQVFHWEKYRAGYVGTIESLAVYIEQRGSRLAISGETPACPRDGLRRSVTHYFALDHCLAKVCASFPDDPTMNAARNFCRGLRLIRQPAWECLATFICSSMKQVAHIRQISRALRERWGKKRSIYGTQVHAFPAPDRLAALTEKELRACALGYRAKDLLATSRMVARRQAKLQAWRRLPDAELRTRLCSLPGVGLKVANCVMLFAYERISAFPIDVWIERVLRETYFPHQRKVTGRELAAFAAEHFGAYGGYAQQYLFHHARMTKRRGAVARARHDRAREPK